MKKNACPVLIMIICSSLLPVAALFAQANKKESFSVNFGAELFSPEGSFRATHRTGFGPTIKAEYTFGKHLSATFNTGFTYFKGKSVFETGSLMRTDYKPLLAIPAKAGARYYLGNFYFSGEAGLVILTRHVNSANAALSVGVGDKIKIGHNKLDISVRQEIWFNTPKNFNIAVLRVAYEIVW
jgi:hypothetical protein